MSTSVSLSSSEDEDVPQLLNIDNQPSVPVTILSGFLGSGKSTLIKNILTSPDHGKRIAIIENEFAGNSGTSGESQSLSVETMIVQDIDSTNRMSDLIELPNGCICCTVKDNLVEALENLLLRRSDFDYILIEASGMANPGPIASLFWLDEALESRLMLDGVVTIVDSSNILKQLKDTSLEQVDDESGGGEAEQQIAFADRIIVNKVDLVDEDHLEEVVKSLRAINPSVPMITSSFSMVSDLDWILNTECFDAERAQHIEATFQQTLKTIQNQAAGQTNALRCSDKTCSTCSTIPTRDMFAGGDENLMVCGDCITEDPQTLAKKSVSFDQNCQKYLHSHTSSIGTVVLVRSGSVDLKKMNTWLAEILWPHQDQQKADNEEKKFLRYMQIFRIKGILSVKHLTCDDADDIDFLSDGLDSRRYIVQAVNDLWEIHPASKTLCWDDAKEDRCCKVVLIGRWLKQEQLEDGFRDCFV